MKNIYIEFHIEDKKRKDGKYAYGLYRNNEKVDEFVLNHENKEVHIDFEEVYDEFFKIKYNDYNSYVNFLTAFNIKPPVKKTIYNLEIGDKYYYLRETGSVWMSHINDKFDMSSYQKKSYRLTTYI